MKENDHFILTFYIDEKTYLGFIDLFNDKNPLHMDDQFAQAKGFQRKVMHGNILGGFISYFVGECLPEKNVVIQTQKIQYKKPVYLGDVLLFHANVDNYFSSVKVAEISFYFENQQKNKVAKGKLQIGCEL